MLLTTERRLTGPKFLAVDLSPTFLNTGTTVETFQQIETFKCSFCWQVFLVCPGIDLESCAGYLGHSSLSKFCSSGAAIDQICSFNGHDETIICTTSFAIHHIICCSLAYGIMISLVPQDQYSLNINTTSSQVLDPTYYKIAIIGETLTIFNKTSLFPITSL